MASKLLLRFGIKFLTYKMVVDREGKLVEFGDLVLNVEPKVDELRGVKPNLLNPPRESEKGPQQAPGTRNVT